MKNKTTRPVSSQRIEAPLTGTIKGKPALMCPFCHPSHVIVPGKRSACGTDLQVRAVQPVYNAKFIKEMRCAKCGRGGGEMAHFANAFAHVADCTPGVAVLAEKPHFSDFARLVYGLPEYPKRLIEKRTGAAVPVDEVLEDGTRTGKILGYFFYRNTVNAQPKPIESPKPIPKTGRRRKRTGTT